MDVDCGFAESSKPTIIVVKTVQSRREIRANIGILVVHIPFWIQVQRMHCQNCPLISVDNVKIKKNQFGFHFLWFL